MSELRVLLHPPFDESATTRLRADLRPGIRIVDESDMAAPGDIRVLVGGRPGAELLDRLTGLEILLLPYAGLPPETATLLKDRPGIRVHNIHHNAPHAAETALALLLAASQNILPADRRMRQGDWSAKFEPNRNLLLAGKKVLVVGYGAIGRRICRMLDGLGVQVTAIRRHPGSTPEDTRVVGADRLPEEAGEARAVILAVPLDDTTRDLVDEAILSRLRDGTILINISRGPVIDEEALYRHAASGRLSLGLDVWWQYPGKDERTSFHGSSFPFHELENVILSPHRAGGYGLDEIEQWRVRDVAGQLNRFLQTGSMT